MISDRTRPFVSHTKRLLRVLDKDKTVIYDPLWRTFEVWEADRGPIRLSADELCELLEVLSP